MTVTEACSAGKVVLPSIVPSVIAQLILKQRLQSSSSRHDEAHSLTAIYSRLASRYIGFYNSEGSMRSPVAFLNRQAETSDWFTALQ